MSAAAADATLCSVLLVEDDADSRDVMSRLLRNAGCEVRATPSVGEALLELEDWLPTHILLDLMLPDAGGIVVLRSVRRRQLPVRIALLTAAGPDSQTVAEAMRWKPDAVFHKPVDFAAVEAWLQEP
jgi:two-component system OmpR family response regulator